MKGGRLYSLVLLLATISALECVPIEIVYTGDSCDCPKSLNYVVNVPPPPKEKTYSPSEYGYKLDVPMQAKAKVTYTFDFTVQEPKTPSPIEQEKWDLFAKIDRITAHKKDCIAEVGSPPNSCSCHRCKASRRYVSSPKRGFTSPSFHPNSLSKMQRPPAPPSSTIAWAALIQPMNRNRLIPPMRFQNVNIRRRRDLSRIFQRNRKTLIKKQATPTVKQYNKSLQRPVAPANRQPLIADIFNGQRQTFQQLRNFMRLPRFRNKRDIKGEYDLIEKERDDMDLTLPEIIQFMPETLDPNFKRGQCRFGECPQQQHQRPPTNDGEEESELPPVDGELGNTLASVDTEVKQQGDDDNADKEEAKDNEISSSSHAKRNAADFGYDSNYNNYNPQNAPSSASPPYAPPCQSLNVPPPPPSSSYKSHDNLPTSYAVAPGPSSQSYQIPQPRAMYDTAPYNNGPYYNAPPLPPPPPPSATAGMYNPDYQLDTVIADIINRHSDFIEAGSHEGGALVDSKSDQKHLNKSLFKSLMGGKWHRYVIEDYYGAAPTYRRAALTDQLYNQ